MQFKKVHFVLTWFFLVTIFLATIFLASDETLDLAKYFSTEK